MLEILNTKGLGLLKFGISNPAFSSKEMIKNAIVKEVKKASATVPFDTSLTTKAEIELVAKTNMQIVKIFNSYNLPIQVNIEELNKLRKGHLEKTREIVAKIYLVLPESLKKDINIFNLQTAALFHDYGKVLIPDKILNKRGKFTEQEREIMELHSEIGYELLKNSGFNQDVLALIKYHHQNLHKTGYPFIDKDFKYGIDFQILNIADKYTALREERSYKNPFGKYEALEIIAKEVNKGLLSQDVYTALIKAV